MHLPQINWIATNTNAMKCYIQGLALDQTTFMSVALKEIKEWMCMCRNYGIAREFDSIRDIGAAGACKGNCRIQKCCLYGGFLISVMETSD